MTTSNALAIARPSVLVVDDVPEVRRLLSSILDISGYRAVEAEDGFDALSLLGSDTFDLVLTDVHMPGLDGLELVRAVRTIAPDTPIVVMTGAGTLVDLGDPRRDPLPSDMRVDGVCLKPFRLDDLIATVRGLVAAQEPAVASP